MTHPLVRTLRAGHVLTGAYGPVVGPAEITMSDCGHIVALDPVSHNALTREEAGALVMPALVNAHDHGRGVRTLAFGAQDQSLETWMPDLARHPQVDPWLNAVVALGRLARSGVAAVNHCHNTQDGAALLAEAEAVSRAARDVGIKVAFAWPFFDRNPLVYGDVAALAALMPAERRPAILGGDRPMRDADTNFALLERAKAFEHETFALQYHPVAPQWAQPETLARIARASCENGRHVHIHLLETEAQKQWAQAHHPQGLVNWLDEIGLLSPRLTVAHAVWLEPHDIALLAQRGVTVAVNISSNLRLRSGTAQVRALLEAGVRVAFGLDGMALDDDEDMLRELRLAWHLNARDSDAVGPGLDPRMILKGAVEHGRGAMPGAREGKSGRIEAGAPADLLVLDYAALEEDCVADDIDPVTLLLGRAQARHVRSLIVHGRQVVDNGACKGIDLPSLERRLTAQARAAYRFGPDRKLATEEMKTAISRYYMCGHCKEV